MANKEKAKITFCGKSAEEVTNSMYLLEYNDKIILMDCGLYQSSSPNLLKVYKINHRNYKIPFKKLNAIILSHAHVDHCGLVPYAFAKGAECTVYVPKNNKPLLKILWEDSLKIFNSDCEKIQRKHNISAVPLYSNEDISEAMEHITELEFNTEYNLFNDTVLKYFHAGHIVGAAQVMLQFKIGNTNKSILYTGDIGSCIEKDYIIPYEKVPYADIVIAETTYANSVNKRTNKDRKRDTDKIKTVIQQCCLDSCNKVLFGVFSLNRLQEILTELYKIYGEDNSFAIPVIIDAPLGKKISNIFDTLVEKNKELWDKVIHWKNIVWVDDIETSRYYQNLNTPQIILSTSNFLTAGRIIGWLKTILPNENNRIFFCGYTGDDKSLAYKIKNNKYYVEIETKRIKNNAGIISLNSFSSHASEYELLERYFDVNYQRIYLVHGDSKNKIQFAEKLRKELSRKNKTSKVCIPSIGEEYKF